MLGLRVGAGWVGVATAEFGAKTYYLARGDLSPTPHLSICQ